MNSAIMGSVSNGAEVDGAPAAPSKSPGFPAEGHRAAHPGRKRSRSGSRIPTSSQGVGEVKTALENDPNLAQYTDRDEIQNAALQAQENDKHRIFTELFEDTNTWRRLRESNRHDSGWVYGPGFQGFGNGWTMRPIPPRLVIPANRKRPGGRRTKELRSTHKARTAQAERSEDLVPIRLDLEMDKLRLRDTFTWNLHDSIIPPQLFAEGLVEDFKIPPEMTTTVVQQVNQSIQEQLQDFHPHPYIEEEALDPHLPYFAYKNDDIRILIKLNITIGHHTLVDQFDWDINNPMNSPEEFARQMASDMCLSGEFMTAIAHSIREQAQLFTKSLYIAGHPFDGRPIEDSDIRDNVLPSPMPIPFRAWQGAGQYAPYLYELNDTDLERTEDVFQREQRQQKRSVNRRGGPNLPDLRDRLRTVRTMVVSSVVPGGAESMEESGMYKPTRSSGRTRRALRADRGEDSDVSETEGSDGESPSRAAANQGTARTRGMRGAASAAQAAMRANLTGSMTPEHLETRPAKRTGGWELIEDNHTGQERFMLRLKMPREKFRRWWREYKAQRAALEQSQQRQGTPLTQSHQRNQSAAFQQAGARGTAQPFGPGNMPPPSQMLNRQIPSGLGQSPQRQLSHEPMQHMQQRISAADGGSETSSPHVGNNLAGQPGPAPTPPTWLTNAIAKLQAERPNDNFQAAMRWDPNLREWQPRIKCNDCDNRMMYKTDPQNPMENFIVHLGRDEHKEKVAAKLRGSQVT